MSQWQVRKEKTSLLWAENLQSYGNQVGLRRRPVPQPTENLRNQAKEPRWYPTAQESKLSHNNLFPLLNSATVVQKQSKDTERGLCGCVPINLYL